MPALEQVIEREVRALGVPDGLAWPADPSLAVHSEMQEALAAVASREGTA